MANEFFGEVADKATKAAEIAGKKVGVVVDLTKLNVKLLEANNSLDKCYTELGKLTYGSVRENAENDEKIEALCKKADGLKSKIYTLKGEIATVKGGNVCRKCGKTNPGGSAFCNFCGSEIEK